MTCYHITNGNLRECAHDPCTVHPYGSDIHAHDLKTAMSIMERRAADRSTPLSLMARRRTANPLANARIRAIRPGGKGIRREQLDDGASKINGMFTDEQWQSFQDAVDRLDYGLAGWDEKHDEQHHIDRREFQRAERALVGYMRSDDKAMRAIRAYIGDEAVVDVARLILSCPKSMNGRAIIGKAPLARCLLSRTHNDMDRKHVIATVLFFGGRCCYCGRRIHKATGPAQNALTATADHLDPISPNRADREHGQPYGETRFGNVALCCHECNKRKANMTMTSWLKANGSRRNSIAAKIREFRNYAMYSPMGETQCAAVDGELAALRERERVDDDVKPDVLMAVARIREHG